MTIPLPNLDDRRWGDLVEEGRALIPLYGPDWTDHNIHDPGIMLMELLAWQTEMDLFWLNRVPDEHRRKFLALAGIQLRPPRPAHTILQLQIAPAANPVTLPATTEFTADISPRPSLGWQTLQAVTAVPGQIAAIQRNQGGQFSDLTPAWQRGEPVLPWGDDPQEDTAFYIGFTRPLPNDQAPSLYFLFAGDKARAEERRRIEAEIARWPRCRTQLSCVDGQIQLVPGSTPMANGKLEHHSVVLEWSYLDIDGHWHSLAVEDETRAFTLNGPVVIKLPADASMGKQAKGSVTTPLYYLCCRLRRGTYDKAPRLHTIVLNGVAAQQTESIGVMAWPIAAGAAVPYEKLSLGQYDRLDWHEDEQGQITELFRDDRAPAFRILNYDTPDAVQLGRLVLEVEQIGVGDGRPWQEFPVSTPSILDHSLQLATREEGRWKMWQSHPDFDASSREDAHFQIDAARGVIRFGDGERGRAVPKGATILAAYQTTQADAGNMPAKVPLTVTPSEHNKALIPKWQDAKKWITDVSNVVAGNGGSAAETIDQAAGRTLRLRQKPQQAVTAKDYQELALDTPGVHLARVAVRPNFHPTYPCYYAPGVVTLIVLSYLPPDRPEPGRALRQRVASYLEQRRILGTRIEVVGPIYKEVAIRASVHACRGTDVARLRQQIAKRIDDFFHPLWGGPSNEGWPFGRDVYRSEVLGVLDQTPGVEHVFSLELIAGGCEPQCGNVCIGPLGLVDAGEHQIEVLAWQADASDCNYENRCY